MKTYTPKHRKTRKAITNCRVLGAKDLISNHFLKQVIGTEEISIM